MKPKSPPLHKVLVWITWRDRVALFRVVSRRGGGWHPVTGGVESGETDDQAARREVREETGVVLRANELVPLNLEHRYEGRFGLALESAWWADLSLRPQLPIVIIDPTEHTEVRWSDRSFAESQVSFEFHRRTLRRCKPHP